MVSAMAKLSHSGNTDLSGKPPLGSREHNIEKLLRRRDRRYILPLGLHVVVGGGRKCRPACELWTFFVSQLLSIILVTSASLPTCSGGGFLV